MIRWPGSAPGRSRCRPSLWPGRRRSPPPGRSVPFVGPALRPGREPRALPFRQGLQGQRLVSQGQLYAQMLRFHPEGVRHGGSLIAVGIEIAVPAPGMHAHPFEALQRLRKPKLPQHRSREARLPAPVMGQILVQIRQVAAAVARHEDLLSHLPVPLQKGHLRPALRRGDGRHEAGGAASDDQHPPFSGHDSFTSPASRSFCRDIRIPSFAWGQVRPPWK